MSGYNLADTEHQLIEGGWTVLADAFVTEQAVPGQVGQGGYTVTLTSPEGAVFTGEGPDRSEAFRAAAGNADLLPPDGNLI